MRVGEFKNFYRFIFLSVIFLPALAQAASFSLKPVKQEIILEPGIKTRESVTVTNNLGYNSYFQIKLKNIELDRPGVYPLTDFLSLTEEEIIVAAGQTKTFYFDINIPAGTAPGGAYGYLQVIAHPNLQTTGEAGVSAALGSTVFVRIKGPIKEKGQLISFGIVGREFKLGTPFWWHFSFENSGNIYLNPYGKVLLTNRLIGTKTLVDIPPGSVLPGQTKLFEVKTDNLGLPGLYSAVLLLNRGYNNEVDMMETSFWFLPWPILIALSVLGLFLIFLLGLKFVKKRNV